MDNTGEAMDRISELPDFIIHRIMSYLKPKEAARTSILSKKWNQLHNSFPILVFDQNYFFTGARRLDVTGGMDYARKTDEKFCETVKKFMEFVDSSLLRFCELKLCIQRLRLLLILLDIKVSAPMLDKWIGLAIENGVKELDFENITQEELDFENITQERNPYTLPQTIFNANLITSLKLVWCRLEQKPSGTLRLHSLKRLTLTRVCLDERLIQKITSDCPVLEHLSFSDCWGFKRFCVSNKAFKLKFIEIKSWSDEIEIVEISIPSLEQLILRFHWERRPRFEISVPLLKTLYLSCISFASEEFNNLISKSPLLENLWMGYCYVTGRIKISSNRLKNLLLYDCKNLKGVDIDTPNLRSFTYDLCPILTTSINVPCPWKISLRCDDGGFNTHELKKFFGASNQIENLSLSLISSKVVSNLDELSGSSPSLALQVGNLELPVYARRLDYYENLLDGVFWICYPRSLKVTVKSGKKYKFLEWITDQLLDRDVNCCNSRHIKCWRHYLKDIKTQNNNPRSSIFYLDWCVPVPIKKS